MQAPEQQPRNNWPDWVDSDTGGRIKALLNHYQLGASQANERLGYARRNSKLYKILANNIRPSYETLVDLPTAFPDLSSDRLLLGRGSMLVRSGASRAATSLSGVGQVLTVTVGKDGEGNTAFVPLPAQAGYPRQFNEAVYLRQLRHYRMPGFESGTYRAFEVSGDSMEPTLNHRDVVVASYVDELRLLVPGEVYVVVTPEAVLLKRIKKRVRAPDGKIMLHSDNSHLRPYGVETRDIRQLWRVQGYVSSYVPSAPDVTIERLWEVIEQRGLDKGAVRRHLEENAPHITPIH